MQKLSLYRKWNRHYTYASKLIMWKCSHFIWARTKRT